MTIASSDVVFYQSENVNDVAGSNGGGIGSTEVVDYILNNLFQNVTHDERVAGVTRYRKMFVRNENVEDLVLYHCHLWISILSTGGDYFRIKPGTDTDVQSAAEGYSNWAGSGTLAANITAGDGSLQVTYDAANGVYDGATIRVDDGVHVESMVVSGAPAFVGNTATINVTGTFTNNFSSGSGTIVSTKINLGNIVADSGSWVETSATGTYDEAGYPLTVYNKGTVTDSWTLTFSDATNFSVSGASTGSVGSGDINTDFQPTNGSSYYFLLDKDGWGGNWQAGDTITFTTTHAGYGVWVKEVVPAATGSLAGNLVALEWEAESASTVTTTTTTTFTFTTTTT